ncbi:MAG: hypothetical protein IJH67_00955 [Thermoguttaceae bacterium]|nr:hypothetical protein [Thermoguttaceae bacterium]
METENNKPTAENDNIASRPSVWERFMTIYTCLLPIVVWVIIVCHFVIHKPMWCEHFGIFLPLPIYLPCSLYIFSVYISLFLVPLIFLGILLYDYYKHKRTIKKRLLNIRDNPQKNTLSRVCNQFHDSFIGEIIHIFLYFVMLGIIFLLFEFSLPKDSIGGGIVIGMAYASLNYIVPIVLALIFLYVLIRRLSIYYARRIRIYKRQKAKRKEALERIRNNRQDNPSV